MIPFLSPPAAAMVRNVSLGLFVVLYANTAVKAGDRMVRRRYLTTMQSRKMVHVGAATTLFFWPYYDTGHWSWRCNSFVALLYVLQFIYKGLILRDRNDRDVVVMTRTGNPMELCMGPLFYCVALSYVGLFEFQTTPPTAIYLMGCMGLGDGIAPLIGSRYPALRCPTYGRDQYKTLSGSLAMFVGSVAGILLLRKALGVQVDEAPLHPHIVSAAFIATVAEALTGAWDNVAVALSVASYVRYYAYSPVS